MPLNNASFRPASGALSVWINTNAPTDQGCMQVRRYLSLVNWCVHQEWKLILLIQTIKCH